MTFILRTLLIFFSALSLTFPGYDYLLYKDGASTANYIYAAADFGDFNGDGKTDVVFVNPYETVAGVACGVVYVYYGKDGQDFSSYDVKFFGSGSGDQFGSSAKFSDVNHDGYDDLLIGASHAKNIPANLENAGAAYVVLGRPSFGSRDNSIDTIYNAAIYGPNNGSRFGIGFALTNGDVNHDGVNDMLVGASGTNEAYLFLGNTSSSISDHLPINLTSPNNYHAAFYPKSRTNRNIGRSLCFCDLNNDGYDDIVIGDPECDGAASHFNGAVWIKYGSSTFKTTTHGLNYTLETSMDAVYQGESANDELGNMIYAADVDGDGMRDLLLGAPTTAGNGQFYVIKNNSLGPRGSIPLSSSANYDAKFTGSETNDQLGFVVYATDVNRDGKAEIFAGARHLNSYGKAQGRVYLINGASVFTGDKTKSLATTSNYLMHFGEYCAEEATDHDLEYQMYIGQAGDVNQDGLKDLYLTDISADGGLTFVVLNHLPQVSLSSPNGGETWTGGETRNITWTYTQTGYISPDAYPISLEYSADGGSTYSLIASGLPNTGSYAWTVPSVLCTTARVRVTAANCLKVSNSAASAANFTIVSTAPAVSIIAPNGGEAWQSGTLHQIQWSANGDPTSLIANPISIYLSLDSGATFGTRIVDSLANTGTYDWSVPSGLDIGTARIKITAQNTLGMNGSGISARDFAITTATGGGDVRVLEIKSGPSPFSPGGSSGMGARAVSTAQIDYKLSSTGNMSIYIFDSTGNLEYKKDYTAGAEGAHVGMNSVPWDGADSGGNLLPNGVYIIKIVAGGKVIGTDKIMIIK